MNINFVCRIQKAIRTMIEMSNVCVGVSFDKIKKRFQFREETKIFEWWTRARNVVFDYLIDDR